MRILGRLLYSLTAATMLAAGADLRKETLSAWDRYVQGADMHASSWIDESAQRRQQLRGGEILVSSVVGASGAKRVPAGLIHHWVGAAFLPNSNVEEVFEVVRDYPRYKDYFQPNVIDSRTIERSAGEDRFSMLLMNKALFLKMALEGEYVSSYTQTSSHKWYSIANTLHLREVEGYGGENEHTVPADQGSGYIWRMHSIARYEEADGGVYIEMETMALSRDIPAAVRWMVDPIVRRVAKGAMTTSLQQTQEAVSSSSRVALKKPGTTMTLGLAYGFR